MVDLREYLTLSPLPAAECEAISALADPPAGRLARDAAKVAAEVMRTAGAQARGLALDPLDMVDLDAALNAAFWCDRRIAADQDARAVMLASARILRDEVRRRPGRRWRGLLKQIHGMMLRRSRKEPPSTPYQ